jgi:hypothetical protein
MKVSGCRWVNIRGSSDPRGTVSFIETGIDLDFSIRRAFWIHGVPVGQPRGHHAHREVRLAMIAVAGAADLVLDDGVTRETVRLDRPDRAMLVEPWIWHELVDFAASTVVLVLASANYAEADYIRDYDTFRREVKERLR